MAAVLSVNLRGLPWRDNTSQVVAEKSESAEFGLSVSAILPAYNEAGNLEPVVRRVREELSRRGPDFEVIIVDDGSEDGTSELADRLCQEDSRFRVVHHPRNLGYGAALRSGFSAATKEWIFFMDADGQFAPQDLEKLFVLAHEHDFIAGFRAPRRDPLGRRVYGALFSALMRTLFGIKARDVNCAFKLFRRRLLSGVELTSQGALINTELLLAAKRQGVIPVEVPVQHLPRRSGKQSGGSLKVILRAMGEVVRLYLRSARKCRS